MSIMKGTTSIGVFKGGPTPTGTIDITENGTVDVTNYATADVNVSKSMFTGHADAIGLAQIGWTEEDIQYFQENGVQWNEEEDEIFELTESEIEDDYNSATRYAPKSPNLLWKNKHNLLSIPFVDKSGATSFSYVFSDCYSLQSIPLLDTSNATEFSSTFYDCYSLTTIPLIDTSSSTDFSSMFSHCYSLITIPLIDTSNGTDFSSMFNACYSLKTIPHLDTSEGINLSAMFQNCYSLKTIPQLDTSNAANLSFMFNKCYSLMHVPELDASSNLNFINIFNDCESLLTMGGLLNAGQAYLTTESTYRNAYTIDLSTCTKLTHDSLMNVINKLYDIATKGVASQKLVLGSTNLAKLTAQEIAIATNKGWAVS